METKGRISKTLLRLWAKYDKETNIAHPLICHMLDSGNVFAAIWDTVLTDPCKKQFQQLFDQKEDQTKKAIQLLVSLHDIGKASAAFQSNVPEMKRLLADEGLVFPKKSHYSPQRHDLISLWILKELLVTKGVFLSDDADLISRVLGGHHGFFHSPTEIRSPDCLTNLAGEEWNELREQVFNALRDLIGPPYSLALHGDIGERQSALVAMTGLVVASDWLASDEQLFPYYIHEDFSLEDYQHLSLERAHTALLKTGWISWKPDGIQVDFVEMFHFDQPNPIQKAVIEHAEGLNSPFLAILEAPTGQGKTEAAFYLADKAIQQFSMRGLYIAMPTMATSNQMFGRTLEFLQNRYPQHLVSLQLVHSQTKWEPAFQSLSLDGIGQDLGNEERGIAAMSWFLPKKRSLLAPFGVGTVDQALISVLKTKHFFLRLFGLSHKVVIFDEVHAYDMYMSELFIRLLEWLKLLGCSVIILSATLPQNMKRRIASVYSGTQVLKNACEYPSLTLVNGEENFSIAIDTGLRQQYRLEFIDNVQDEITNYLSSKLINGGCAAVICNTVNKAQSVYKAIREANILDTDNDGERLILFHARNPYLWRQEVEKEVLNSFGKHGSRPSKSILVATQLIEQSLDLDFDLMVSELCPIDLLIQRAGRLHRHPDHSRPKKLTDPVFCIALSEKDGDLEVGVDKWIYDEDILLATYMALKGKNSIMLPLDTRMLIEQVYNPNHEKVFSEEQLKRISTLHEKIQKKHYTEISIARSKLIPQADDERVLQIGDMYLEEDHPDIHQAFQALTRLMLPSISLVCLIDLSGYLFAIDGQTEISLEEKMNDNQIETLLKSSINVTRWSIIDHFTMHVVRPEQWQRNPALRYSFPAIFREGVCQLNEKVSLVLDKELGLQYMEE